MIAIALPIVFFASLAGLIYLIGRKIPVLADIPQESLASQETFIQFLLRMAKALIFFLNPRRWRVYFLSKLAQFLNELKIWFSKAYHIIEAMAKKARQESQRMEWEHHWFSQKEVTKNGNAENPSPASDGQNETPDNEGDNNKLPG